MLGGVYEKVVSLQNFLGATPQFVCRLRLPPPRGPGSWSAEAPGFNPVAERLLGAVAAVDDSGIPPIHPHTVALPPYGSYFANPRPDQPDYTPLRFQVGKNGLRYSQGTIN